MDISNDVYMEPTDISVSQARAVAILPPYWQEQIEKNRIVEALKEKEISVKPKGKKREKAAYQVNDEKSEKRLPNLREVLGYVKALGKKGLALQRYKGLGEMNPSQLWETTMNPDTRTLLQVKIDDAVVTDEIFNILMGDAVEPRRKFIEENALNVKNLDI